MAVKNFVVKNGLDTPVLNVATSAVLPTNTSIGNVSSTELGYLDGVTSAIQTQLGNKQPLDADLTAIAALAGTSGFLKKTATDTWALDTNTYITGNQTITLSGDASGSGTTAITVTVADDSHAHTGTTISALDASDITTGALATARGGTGLGSFTSGGAVYATSTSVLTTGTLPVASGGTGTTTSTGSGSVVLSTSPSLTTPTLGAATATTINGLTLTAAATGFTIAGGTTSKTLTVSNTLTLAGTDSSTLNIGSGGTLGSAAFTASTAYLSSAVSHTQHGYFNNVWLTDSNNSHHLRLNAGGNDLTANRLLNIFVNDSDRTLNLLGSFEFSGGAGTIPVDFGSVGGTVSYSTHTHTGSTISALDAADITTGALAVGVGGTGTSTAPTQGGFIYASSASSYASVAGTAGYFVKAGGTGAPTFAASTGSGSVVLDTTPSLTNAAITSAWIRPGYVSFTTSNFDLGTIDYTAYEGKMIAMNSASAQSITVNNTSVPVGTTLTFVKMGSGAVTIVDGTAVTAATPGLKFRTLYSVVSLTKITEGGTDTWLAYGDLSA